MAVESEEDIQVETTPKRVRAYLGGQLVVDTIRARLVWENPHYPAYYVPRADVRGVREAGAVAKRFGQALAFDVVAGDKIAAAAAWQYLDASALRELVRIEWSALDAWFEEEEEVFGHPHDPYKRIDVLHGSRHVRVELAGMVLAETRRPTLLLETGLPLRYYVPRTDVRMDLLTPIAKRTCCAYKGYAQYWVVEQGGKVIEPDVAWSYPFPLAECVKIAGMIGFYNETLDIHVDGVLLEKPVTKFSRSR